MLNKKQILIILALCIVPFLFYFARPDLFGTDTYYFYAVACGNAKASSIPLISEFVFSVMPCDFNAFKITSFLLLVSAVLIVSFMGSLFNKEFGWLAGVFLFLNSLTVLEFARLEDDTLAYPFLFAAMMLFLLGIRESKNAYKLCALGLVLLSGLIWKGAFVYLVGFSLSFTPALIVLILVFFFVIKNLSGAINAFYTNFEVLENLPIIGLAYQLFLLIGFLGVKAFFVVQLVFFAFLAFINAKFGVHLSPILALGLVFVIQKVFARPEIKAFPEHPVRKWLVPVVLIYAFVIAGATGWLILNQFPTASQTEAVQFAVEQSGNVNMSNDWSYGYWIIAYGGETRTFGGGWPIYNDSNVNRFLLTENPKPVKSCRVLKEWKRGGFDNADIRVYDCQEALE